MASRSKVAAATCMAPGRALSASKIKPRSGWAFCFSGTSGFGFATLFVFGSGIGHAGNYDAALVLDFEHALGRLFGQGDGTLCSERCFVDSGVERVELETVDVDLLLAVLVAMIKE